MTGGGGRHNPFPGNTSSGSGSGGGGSQGGPDGGSDGGPLPPDCNITFTAVLVSPVAAVLAGIKVGDTLGMAILTATLRGREVKSLGVTHAGQRAGDIDDRRADKVVACIEAGVGFAAQVERLSGLQCQVRVYPG